MCKEGYVYHSWHASLLTIAFTFCAISFNTIMIGQLPFLEGSAVILHICGFIAIIVVIWVMVRKGRRFAYLLANRISTGTS